MYTNVLVFSWWFGKDIAFNILTLLSKLCLLLIAYFLLITIGKTKSYHLKIWRQATIDCSAAAAKTFIDTDILFQKNIEELGHLWQIINCLFYSEQFYRIVY